MSMKAVYAAAVAITFSWVIWVLQKPVLVSLGSTWEPEKLGQWGDSFGALNALFSAFAFVAVLFTLKQQRDDLAGQQEQISKAERDQHIRHFEQTFYELLRLLREARGDVEFRHSRGYLILNPSQSTSAAGKVKGTEAFKRANMEMRNWVELSSASGADLTSQAIAALYEEHVHSRYESSFAPYYRLLYTLLLRIKDDKVLEDAQRYRYVNLLRSQLTSHEVALCCYNGLAAVSGSFKSLIAEFRLAKYLPEEFGRLSLLEHYPPETFKGRD